MKWPLYLFALVSEALLALLPVLLPVAAAGWALYVIWRTAQWALL